MNLKIPIDSNFTCIIYCKIFDFVSITRNLYRVKLLSQNYLANGYTSKLESEKTGRRYLDPLAEILRATSSVYFLPKVVSYATLPESKTHPKVLSSPTLPLYRWRTAETTSRMFVGLPPPLPRFHADSSLSPFLLTQWRTNASQMRIFESAKKIIQ